MARSKEEQIRRVAHELYQRRLLLNRAGDSESDWKNAEAVVQKPLQRFLFICNRPFINLEKNLWEPLLAWAENQALLNLLGIMGNIGILVAVAIYIGTEKQRRDAEVLNAWQTITSAYDQPGSGGRIQALEFLNASPGANWRRRLVCLNICTWPAESLDGINLSAALIEESEQEDYPQIINEYSVYLRGVSLPKADLFNANLRSVNLNNANLSYADLTASDLSGSRFQNANLRYARLSYSDLRRAFFLHADLSGADLRGANLGGAALSNSILNGTDLSETKNLLVGQLKNEPSPLLCGIKMPTYINRTEVDPERDCEILPQVLVDRYGWSLEDAQAIVETAKRRY